MIESITIIAIISFIIPTFLLLGILKSTRNITLLRDVIYYIIIYVVSILNLFNCLKSISEIIQSTLSEESLSNVLINSNIILKVITLLIGYRFFVFLFKDFFGKDSLRNILKNLFFNKSSITQTRIFKTRSINYLLQVGFFTLTISVLEYSGFFSSGNNVYITVLNFAFFFIVDDYFLINDYFLEFKRILFSHLIRILLLNIAIFLSCLFYFYSISNNILLFFYLFLVLLILLIFFQNRQTSF